MTYLEYQKEQEIRDNRREFIRKGLHYLDLRLDQSFRDEIYFIHRELMKGDYY